MKISKAILHLLPLTSIASGRAVDRPPRNICGSDVNPFISRDRFAYANMGHNAPPSCFRTITSSELDDIIAQPSNKLGRGGKASVYKYPSCSAHAVRVRHDCTDSIRQASEKEHDPIPVSYPINFYPGKGLGLPVAVLTENTNRQSTSVKELDEACITLLNRVSGRYSNADHSQFRDSSEPHSHSLASALLHPNSYGNVKPELERRLVFFKNGKVERLPLPHLWMFEEISPEIQSKIYPHYLKFEKDYARFVRKLAAMDQSVFDLLVQNWKQLRHQKYDLDLQNAGNILIDLDKQVISIVDVNFGTPLSVTSEQSLSRLTQVLLGSLDNDKPWENLLDKNRRARATLDAKLLEQKMQIAADKHSVAETISIDRMTRALIFN